MADSEQIVDDGAEAVDERGVGGAVRSLLIGGSIMALATTVVEVITGIPGTFLAPLTAFADGLATLIGGTLGAPVRSPMRARKRRPTRFSRERQQRSGRRRFRSQCSSPSWACGCSSGSSKRSRSARCN